MTSSQSEILLYTTSTGEIKVEVVFENETVWLTQDQMAELFGKGRSTITEHIQNIFKEGELLEKSVCREIRRTATDRKNYFVKYYSLDVIISVGYRVKSTRGTQFRIWATEHLKEYLVKGFILDSIRLKQGGHKSRYFEELLQQIRDIRSSERMLYQKVTDIYATSIDYQKDTKETGLFFKTVQNKMHYAVTKKTAAQIIIERVHHKKVNLGLTNFPGHNPIQRDIYIAKNYLYEEELQTLNRIVDAYLSFAELQAMNERPMKMIDWINKLNEFLKLMGRGVLNGSGIVSMDKAVDKANEEFTKYKKLANKKYVSDFDKMAKKMIEKGKRVKV